MNDARRPIAVACALVERGGRVLVARRPAHKALPLQWEFPGGKLEPGESAAAALAREMHEEFGVELVIGKQLATVTHDYGDAVIALTPFVCALRDAAEPVPTEHVAARWCTPDEIEALELAAADRPVLRAYREHRQTNSEG